MTQQCHLQNPPEWGISGGLPVATEKKKGWNRLWFSFERLDQWCDLDQPQDSDKVPCYQTKVVTSSTCSVVSGEEVTPSRGWFSCTMKEVSSKVCAAALLSQTSGGPRDLLKNMLAPSPRFLYTEEQRCRGQWWSPQQALRTWVATGIASGVFKTTHIVSFCIEKHKKKKDETEKSSGESQLYQSGSGSKEQLQPHMIMTAYSSL